MKEIGCEYPVRFFPDGVNMLEALRSMQPPERCLLIVDGYMPKLSGMDLIRIMYQENALCQHDVAMLTDSIAPGV